MDGQRRDVALRIGDTTRSHTMITLSRATLRLSSFGTRSFTNRMAPRYHAVAYLHRYSSHHAAAPFAPPDRRTHLETLVAHTKVVS
jgi:hypothetical protein